MAETEGEGPARGTPRSRRPARSRNSGEASAGDIVGTTFETFFKEFPKLLLLTAIVYLPYLGLVFFVLVDSTVPPQAIRILNFLFDAILSGTIAYGVFQRLRGEPAPVGQWLSVGFRRVLLVIAVSICSTLLLIVAAIPILLGVFALGDAGFVVVLIGLVPLIYVALMLQVAIPAAVVERLGPVAAIRRSAELTKGRKGTVFLVLFVIGLLGFILGVLVGVVAVAAESSLIGIAVAVMIGTVNAVATVVMYREFRRAEGADLDDLVKVFA